MSSTIPAFLLLNFFLMQTAIMKKNRHEGLVFVSAAIYLGDAMGPFFMNLARRELILLV